MPRTCTICTHSDRDTIDRALMAGEALRDIARRCRVSKDALARHKADHLPATLIQAQEAQEVARGDDRLVQLKAIIARVQKLFDACDAWLSDPLDPARYEVGPRAEDVQVIYTEEGPDGKKVRYKDRLSTLLRQAGQGRLSFEVIEVKHADPRELVLKTANTLRGALEMMLKVVEVKDLEKRLEGLEHSIEGRGERWTSVNGSTRFKSATTTRR